MSEGFLGRWSRRKEAVREGQAVEPEPTPAPVAATAPAAAAATAAPAPAAPEPPPTLADVDALTADADFTRFARPDVPPDVKNAAMKKLFSDPHFNAMDGLDVYIDDYSKPDPIPPEMLRKLASASFLKLFGDEEDEAGKDPAGREVADAAPAQSVAQSGTAGPSAPAVPPPAEPHADPDLRLQQDDAPGPEEPGAGAR